MSATNAGTQVEPKVAVEMLEDKIIMNWSTSVARMAVLEPDYLMPGHTVPKIRKESATVALQDYSEVIGSVYSQTVSGIKDGKSSGVIVREVVLPAQPKDKPYLVELCGTVPRTVRGISTGLLGWFVRQRLRHYEALWHKSMMLQIATTT